MAFLLLNVPVAILEAEAKQGRPGRGGPGPRVGWATGQERSAEQTWLEKKTMLIISQAQLQKRLSSAADYK